MRVNVIVITLLLLFAPLTFAQETGFEKVVQYAEQYEAGQLNFLQFKVLLLKEREAFFDKLNENVIEVAAERDMFRGWDESTMHSLFGEPNEMEQWAWSQSERMSIKLKEPVPKWRRAIYKGSKIEVIFESWPQIFAREGESILFHEFDLRTQFKREVDFNVRQMIGEVKVLMENGRNNGEKLKEAAEKSARYERILGDYLYQNKEFCKEIIGEWLTKSGEEKSNLRWSASLYDGEKVVIGLEGDEWTETEWHGFNSWVREEWRIENLNAQVEEQFNFDYGTPQEYFIEIRNAISELKRAAANLDANPSEGNLAQLKGLIQKYRQLQDQLNRKVGSRQIEFGQDDLVSEFEKVFAEQRDFKKENLKKIEFKERLVNISKEVSGTFCSASENYCGDANACVHAVCVSAKGGNEQCTNERDDDGDSIIDCEDPDCFDFLACGRMCESVCGGEGGCWSCSGEQCSSDCEACNQCNQNNPNNGEACQSVCEPCNTCNNLKCENKCETCWNCQDEYYGSGCRQECKQCTACNDASGNRENNGDCSQECFSCSKCEFDKGNRQCEAPHVLNIQNYNCECPAMQCGECQRQDWETCSCVAEEGCVPRSEEDRQRESRQGEEQAQIESAQETNANQTPVQSIESQPQTQPVQTQLPVDTANATKLPEPRVQVSSYLFTGLVTASEGACNGPCSANQYCNAEKGWCECGQGYFDCDGDWVNGCESTVQCSQCQSNAGCAPTRCSEDARRLVTFECKQGDAWVEEVASAEFGAFCGEYNSGKFENGAWFGAWGEGFDDFEMFKSQAQQEQDRSYCEREFEQAVKERMELQSSLNDEFFNWFFEEFVLKDPSDFENHMRAVHGIYEAFQRNSDETARSLRCLSRSDWPSEYVPIRANVETPFGKVEIWEEKKRTGFWGVEQDIFSPYIQMWVFPSKEVFKRFFVEKIKEEGPQGPKPEELAEIRKSPEAMDKIKRIANTFGGDARIKIQAVDEDTPLAGFMFIVNERDLIRIEDSENYNGPVSATVNVKLDFVYDVASMTEKESKEGRVEYQFWEHGKEPVKIVDDFVMAVKIFARIFQGIAQGEITVEPTSAAPAMVTVLNEMMAMILQHP